MPLLLPLPLGLDDDDMDIEDEDGNADETADDASRYFGEQEFLHEPSMSSARGGRGKGGRVNNARGIFSFKKAMTTFGKELKDSWGKIRMILSITQKNNEGT